MKVSYKEKDAIQAFLNRRTKGPSTARLFARARHLDDAEIERRLERVTPQDCGLDQLQFNEARNALLAELRAD